MVILHFSLIAGCLLASSSRQHESGDVAGTYLLFEASIPNLYSVRQIFTAFNISKTLFCPK